MTPAEAAAAADFGTATAAKRGRNPKYPYVPVVRYGDRTDQIRAKAFVTRDEAVAYAQEVIDYRRQRLAEDLARPNYRALRAQYGVDA